MRIVSLLPSATEIVCALGLSEALVGVSHDCDYPPEIGGKPVLSEAIVTSDLPSREIEDRIRTQLHRGRSVYHLDEAQLARLAPDLILTQELCAVCAPSYTLVRQAARVLDAQTRLVSLEPRNLHEILDNVLLVGEYTDRQFEAQALEQRLRTRIEKVVEVTSGRGRPRAICLEWFDSLYVAGHWIPEMVRLAGGEDLLGKPGEPSFMVEWDEVLAASPDVLILMPCGFDISRAREEVHVISRRPAWGSLPAVRAGRVYLTDGSAYFNRPGPRIVDGLEILAALLHPEAAGAIGASGGWESL